MTSEVIQVQEASFDFWKLAVLFAVFALFYMGSKANDLFSSSERLSFGQSAVFLISSFLIIAFPFCHLVYEAFLSSRDLFVWVGSVVPPLTAGFTARTQMAKLLEGN